MARIGVLALQGSFTEHLKILRTFSGIEALPVKCRDDLEQVDGIILPGGESTTISLLLHQFDLFNLLKSRIESGMPVWGTCAGLILLASELDGEMPHLAVMNIRVRRNAYGSQIDSFATRAVIPAFGSTPLDLVFIRAPIIETVAQPAVVLATLNGQIIAARQSNRLATTFHPELTVDPAVHAFFIDLVNQSVSADPSYFQDAIADDYQARSVFLGDSLKTQAFCSGKLA